jgi:N-succinyldiaminopimelate aminotransferase
MTEPMLKVAAAPPGVAGAAGVSRRVRRSFGANIFTEMSVAAQRHGAVNLGQGFPDTSGPSSLVQAAARAMRAGENQYPPVAGIPALREAIARHQRRCYGIDLDPATGVLVTAGASEAITAVIFALIEPGDEVVVLEPYYDLYAAAIAMAGGRLVPVPLRRPGFGLDAGTLRRAVTERTALLLINSPHNPSGTVLGQNDLHALSEVAISCDLLVLADEVYEHLVFDCRSHVPLASLPGMAVRTLTVSSAGKTFSMTGWKIGWCGGPPELVSAALGVKQYLSFASGTPFQHAVAEALGTSDYYWQQLTTDLQRQRDLLADGLIGLGMEVNSPGGGYFLTADIRGITDVDAKTFCRALPASHGVAAIPNQVFYADPTRAATEVRFAFCKREDVLREAVRRLQAGDLGSIG